ncbi:alkene reductase [Dongia rigui]|uniref:Alkene reductase n=1 Tax=Dongia rigui TaxID=940149 RepID=A0ABU5DWN5_9PROT|nr:alkene reductase [Dongia rigui]MDY0870991.1 alkene reductase [Dongia rigui]
MSLFDTFDLGALRTSNRIVMAPMTRNRSPGGVAAPMNATYYAQRASAGLIITESSQISPQGVSYFDTPGIHEPRQVAAWRLVTERVHAAGGRIFLQLCHAGRISHPSLLPEGTLPVAPSAITPAGQAYTAEGLQPFVQPRALSVAEIARIVDQFAAATANAKAADFDGVEIHAACGYLIDQFLRDGSNQRSDSYGGPIANRVRFLLKVVEAAAGAWAPNRVGVRLSPWLDFNDMRDSNPAVTFTHAASELGRFDLAYLHLVEPLDAAARGGAAVVAPQIRRVFGRPLILNTGYDQASATRAIDSGAADLIAFGTAFIANPDLPDRLRRRLPLQEADRKTFYGGGARGYTDYPAYSEPERQAID